MKVRPIVVVSRCLGFAACRYDGTRLEDDFVRRLRKHVKFVQICPEMEIGMGTPRDPVRLVRGAMIQTSTGRNFTAKMKRFSRSFLKGLVADGFILKSRSPSCGVRDTKQHPAPVERGPGLFGAAVLKHFPDAAVEDERRLAVRRHRHKFLTRLFLNAAVRSGRTPRRYPRALAE